MFWQPTATSRFYCSIKIPVGSFIFLARFLRTQKEFLVFVSYPTNESFIFPELFASFGRLHGCMQACREECGNRYLYHLNNYIFEYKFYFTFNLHLHLHFILHLNNYTIWIIVDVVVNTVNSELTRIFEELIHFLKIILRAETRVIVVSPLTPALYYTINDSVAMDLLFRHFVRELCRFACAYTIQIQCYNLRKSDQSMAVDWSWKSGFVLLWTVLLVLDSFLSAFPHEANNVYSLWTLCSRYRWVIVRRTWRQMNHSVGHHALKLES